MDRRQLSAYLGALFIEPGSPLTWQTFAERPDVIGSRHLTRTWTEPARDALPKLRRLNGQGAGVFLTVQETDGLGRKAANVRRVRALYVDIEDKDPRAWHLEPSLVVVTGKGRHAYWVLADDLPLERFTTAQKRLIAFYGSDPAVHDLARVMRVPGSLHLKGEPCPVVIESTAAFGVYPWRQVLAGLPELVKARAPRPDVLAIVRASGGAWNREQIDVNTLKLSQLFTDLGMARGDMRDGLPVWCPWADAHTDDTSPTATMVWDGDGARPAGFKCLHAHCSDRSLRDVLAKYRQHLTGYAETQAAPSRAALAAAEYLEGI